jgi:hypothetical protein
MVWKFWNRDEDAVWNEVRFAMGRCIQLESRGPCLTVLIDWWQLAASSTIHYGQTWHAEAKIRIWACLFMRFKIFFNKIWKYFIFLLTSN